MTEVTIANQSKQGLHGQTAVGVVGSDIKHIMFCVCPPLGVFCLGRSYSGFLTLRKLRSPSAEILLLSKFSS